MKVLFIHAMPRRPIWYRVQSSSTDRDILRKFEGSLTGRIHFNRLSHSSLNGGAPKRERRGEPVAAARKVAAAAHEVAAAVEPHEVATARSPRWNPTSGSLLSLQWRRSLIRLAGLLWGSSPSLLCKQQEVKALLQRLPWNRTRDPLAQPSGRGGAAVRGGAARGVASAARHGAPTCDAVRGVR